MKDIYDIRMQTHNKTGVDIRHELDSKDKPEIHIQGKNKKMKNEEEAIPSAF